MSRTGDRIDLVRLAAHRWEYYPLLRRPSWGLLPLASPQSRGRLRPWLVFGINGPDDCT